MTDHSRQPASELLATELFAAQCAHDLNNLLTGILGNLELMQNRAARNGISDFDGYLAGARDAAGRAAGFAQRLLAYSGRAAQDLAAVQVDTLAASLPELFAGRIEAMPRAAGACVFCCPTLLETVLLELLGNARDACMAGGEIRLATAASETMVTIGVADTGCGMPAEILALACQPFFSSHTNAAGRGLGLAIADRFAARHGGALLIESRPAEGTTVKLCLPRHWPD